MATKILIKNNKKEIVEYWIHEEHECDMFDFLKNHKKNGETFPKIKGLKWFYFNVNNEDIEKIKKTCWYKNEKSYNENIINELNNAKEIEVIMTPIFR